MSPVVARPPVDVAGAVVASPRPAGGGPLWWGGGGGFPLLTADMLRARIRDLLLDLEGDGLHPALHLEPQRGLPQVGIRRGEPGLLGRLLRPLRVLGPVVAAADEHVP